ncbi:MAG: ribokinase [Clostridia bacterium]|nr:ribokinase [Clostridia bacterium]
MKAVVFGSMNIDKVYSLAHLPEKGETLYTDGYEIHVGGKGLNQAVSLAKSGADVSMAGWVGTDGGFLTDFLNESGVNTDMIQQTNGFTGHAVIEVDRDGQNQMILFPGANKEITENYCDTVLESLCEGDLLLMQYETSQVEYMLRKAHSKGIITALNPSPYVDEIKKLPFDCVDYLILNESEGQMITDKTDVTEVVEALKALNPDGVVILTLGGDGSVYADKSQTVSVPAFKVNAVDTTGAGDTFTGYCLNAVLNGAEPCEALRTASAASAIVVTKIGAAQTIPTFSEVKSFLSNLDKN